MEEAKKYFIVKVKVSILVKTDDWAEAESLAMDKLANTCDICKSEEITAEEAEQATKQKCKDDEAIFIRA